MVRFNRSMNDVFTVDESSECVSAKRQHAGRGAVGKVAVAGVKDRDTNRVSAAVVDHTDGATLRGFVQDRTKAGALVYTDDATAYVGLPSRETVKHSVGRVRQRSGQHERLGVVLEPAEARLLRHVSPSQSRAPGPLRRGVRRSPQ